MLGSVAKSRRPAGRTRAHHTKEAYLLAESISSDRDREGTLL